MRDSDVFLSRRDKISIQEKEDNRYLIRSRPSFWFEILDNGRKIAHIKHIVEKLTELGFIYWKIQSAYVVQAEFNIIH